MRSRKTTLAALIFALLLVGNGCDLFRRRKPSPPPSVPPTLEHPKIELPQPQPSPPPATPEPEPSIPPTRPEPKIKPKPKHTPKKVVVPPAPAENTPEPAKPAPDPGINATMTNAQAERQRQQTSSLLGSAETNLSSIHRSLDVDEQNMVSQIRNYIAQSRKAMTDGDLERAYNLANKANLLSTELAKD